MNKKDATLIVIFVHFWMTKNLHKRKRYAHKQPYTKIYDKVHTAHISQVTTWRKMTVYRERQQIFMIYDNVKAIYILFVTVFPSPGNIYVMAIG